MPDLPPDLRLILAHKQKTSARLRFLRFSHGLTAFTPLPALAAVMDEDAEAGQAAPRVSHHPSAWLRATEERLELPNGCLRPEREFTATVDTPQGRCTVQLASIDTLDPPFQAAEALGARFVTITEARDCPAVELELLRRAYTILIG